MTGNRTQKVGTRVRRSSGTVSRVEAALIDQTRGDYGKTNLLWYFYFNFNSNVNPADKIQWVKSLVTTVCHLNCFSHTTGCEPHAISEIFTEFKRHLISFTSMWPSDIFGIVFWVKRWKWGTGVSVWSSYKHATDRLLVPSPLMSSLPRATALLKG